MGDGPLKIPCHLGHLPTIVMVDTGSDYDCINKQYADHERSQESIAWRRELTIDSDEKDVGTAFDSSERREPEGLGEWNISFYGSTTFGGQRKSHNVTVALYEFSQLHEKIILGMPFVDSHGGLQVDSNWVYMNSIWTSRILPTPRTKYIESMCRLPHVPEAAIKGDATIIDDKGWYAIDVVVDPFKNYDGQSKYWIEDSESYDHLRVLENPMIAEDIQNDTPGIMRIMVTADMGHQVALDSHRPICNIREMDSDDVAIFDSLGCLQRIQVIRNSYKSRSKTDEQSKHFEDLKREIEDRRNALKVEPWDQTGPAYKQFLRDFVNEKKGTEQRLCPDDLADQMLEEIIIPFSDCFWHEGCCAPSIKGYKARIRIKPDADMKRKNQPYTLSKFDQARVAYHIEEQLYEGKIFKLGPNDAVPPCVVPVFVVDKEGSYLGRMVGAYQYLNPHTEDYFTQHQMPK